jgi:hypothetical protein
MSRNDALELETMPLNFVPYAQYAQYAIMVSICRVFTPYFADGPARSNIEKIMAHIQS